MSGSTFDYSRPVSFLDCGPNGLYYLVASIFCKIFSRTLFSSATYKNTATMRVYNVSLVRKVLYGPMTLNFCWLDNYEDIWEEIWTYFPEGFKSLVFSSSDSVVYIWFFIGFQNLLHMSPLVLTKVYYTLYQTHLYAAVLSTYNEWFYLPLFLSADWMQPKNLGSSLSSASREGSGVIFGRFLGNCLQK